MQRGVCRKHMHEITIFQVKDAEIHRCKYSNAMLLLIHARHMTCM